jgi:hypothetical protein
MNWKKKSRRLGEKNKIAGRKTLHHSILYMNLSHEKKKE